MNEESSEDDVLENIRSNQVANNIVAHRKLPYVQRIMNKFDYACLLHYSGKRDTSSNRCTLKTISKIYKLDQMFRGPLESTISTRFGIAELMPFSTAVMMSRASVTRCAGRP